MSVLAACGDQKSSKSRSNTSNENKPKQEAELPDGLYAKFTVTGGLFTIRLEMDKVPLTVANFVALAEGNMPNKARPIGQPYYDGLTFHRVITAYTGQQDFMVQGGDPAGNGSGGPGYSFRDEFHPELKHRHGMLSMANSGPNTNGSQFFICVSTPSHLDGKHSVFGEVIKGYDVVYKIRQYDVIKQVEIIRQGEKAKNFDAMATFNSLK